MLDNKVITAINNILKLFTKINTDSSKFSDIWEKLNGIYKYNKNSHNLRSNLDKLLGCISKLRGGKIAKLSIFEKSKVEQIYSLDNINLGIANSESKDNYIKELLAALKSFLANNIDYEALCFILFIDESEPIKRFQNKKLGSSVPKKIIEDFKAKYKCNTNSSLTDDDFIELMTWYGENRDYKDYIFITPREKASPKKSCNFCNNLMQLASTACDNCKIDELKPECPDCHSNLTEGLKVCPECQLKFSDYKNIEKLDADLFDFKRDLDWQNAIITAQELLKYWSNNQDKIAKYKLEIDNANNHLEEKEKEILKKRQSELSKKLNEDLVNAKSKLYWRKVIAISEELIKCHKGDLDKVSEYETEIEKAKQQIDLKSKNPNKKDPKANENTQAEPRKKWTPATRSFFGISTLVAFIGLAAFLDSGSVIAKIWGFLAMSICGTGSFMFLKKESYGCLFYAGGFGLALGCFFWGFLSSNTSIFEKFLALLCTAFFGLGTLLLVLTGTVNYNDEN